MPQGTRDGKPWPGETERGSGGAPQAETCSANARRPALAGLPKSMRLLVEMGITERAVVGLMEAYGGTVIRVPNGADCSTYRSLAEALGEAVARDLVRIAAGLNLPVPSGYRMRLHRRNEEIRAAYDDGEGIKHLVRRFGITERQVWKVLGEAPEEDDGTQG